MCVFGVHTATEPLCVCVNAAGIVGKQQCHVWRENVNINRECVQVCASHTPLSPSRPEFTARLKPSVRSHFLNLTMWFLVSLCVRMTRVGASVRDLKGNLDTWRAHDKTVVCDELGREHVGHADIMFTTQEKTTVGSIKDKLNRQLVDMLRRSQSSVDAASEVTSQLWLMLLWTLTLRRDDRDQYHYYICCWFPLCLKHACCFIHTTLSLRGQKDFYSF